MCRLISRKSDSKMKYAKYFFCDYFSADFWQKLCRSESTLNCWSHHSRTKLTHTTWVVWEANLDWRVVMANYVCMYVKEQLEDYLEKYSLLSKLQSGCRKGFSSETAVNFVINRWKKIGNNKKIMATFLDFFETIVRKIMIANCI